MVGVGEALLIRVSFGAWLGEPQNAALLFPVQREPCVPHETNPSEFGWLPAFDDSFRDVGSEEGQPKKAGDI